jgi:hypothetical protein
MMWSDHPFPGAVLVLDREHEPLRDEYSIPLPGRGAFS